MLPDTSPAFVVGSLMRLWTLHPKYLDPPGLVALWRESLLAQAVLAGRTRGYLAHPQLDRFRSARDPRRAIRCYLEAVLAEARRRGYAFEPSRIDGVGESAQAEPIPVSEGQLTYERRLLAEKLRRRNPAALAAIESPEVPEAHPLFRIVPGGIEPWERPKELTRRPGGKSEDRSVEPPHPPCYYQPIGGISDKASDCRQR